MIVTACICGGALEALLIISGIGCLCKLWRKFTKKTPCTKCKDHQ